AAAPFPDTLLRGVSGGESALRVRDRGGQAARRLTLTCFLALQILQLLRETLGCRVSVGRRYTPTSRELCGERRAPLLRAIELRALGSEALASRAERPARRIEVGHAGTAFRGNISAA